MLHKGEAELTSALMWPAPAAPNPLHLYLHDVLIKHMLNFLSAADTVRFSRTCKPAAAFLLENRIWEGYIRRDFHRLEDVNAFMSENTSIVFQKHYALRTAAYAEIQNRRKKAHTRALEKRARRRANSALLARCIPRQHRAEMHTHDFRIVLRGLHVAAGLMVGLLCGVHWSVVGPIVAFAASTTLWWFRSVLSPLCWALVLAIFTLAPRRRFLRWSCSAASAVVLALVFEWTFFPSLSFLFARALYRSCFLFLLFTAGVNFFGRLSDAWALRIIARWPALNQHFGLVGFFIMWPLNVSGIFTTIAFFSCPHVMNNLPSHSPVLLYILKWLLRLLLCITAGAGGIPVGIACQRGLRRRMDESFVVLWAVAFGFGLANEVYCWLLNVELVFSYSFASMLLVSLQSLVVVGDVGCFFGFPVAILFATRWRQALPLSHRMLSEARTGVLLLVMLTAFSQGIPLTLKAMGCEDPRIGWKHVYDFATAQ